MIDLVVRPVERVIYGGASATHSRFSTAPTHKKLDVTFVKGGDTVVPIPMQINEEESEITGRMIAARINLCLCLAHKPQK